MDGVYWLIIVIVMAVIEIITLGLTTIWFAGGALVAFRNTWYGQTYLIPDG